MQPAEHTYQPARGGSYLTQDFDLSSFTMAWEITRSCALACVHCRAEAIPKRDPPLLKGVCGRCEFSAVCGGSRARAYAMTGDYLAPDPSCPYAPTTLQRARLSATMRGPSGAPLVWKRWRRVWSLSYRLLQGSEELLVGLAALHHLEQAIHRLDVLGVLQ